MCRTQSLAGLCALLALTGCKGEICSGPGQTATPSSGPGHCVPYEPFAGYKTCVMSAPQISKSYGVTSRRPSSDDALPTFVDHRTYMRGCVTVHNQGICGWCVANSVTGMLEAELCREKKPSERISEPHLWSLGVANQTVADTECAGGWFMDKAVEAAASTYLVPNLAWPYPPEDEWRAT